MKIEKSLQKTPYILNCQTNFYQDLYKEVNLENDVSINSFRCENESKLSDKDSKELEGEILYSKLGLALKNMKNNVKYFKKIWAEMGHFIFSL